MKIWIFPTIYVEVINPRYVVESSASALQGVAEALRLAVKLLGLEREASPSGVANSMRFFVSGKSIFSTSQWCRNFFTTVNVNVEYTNYIYPLKIK